MKLGPSDCAIDILLKIWPKRRFLHWSTVVSPVRLRHCIVDLSLKPMIFISSGSTATVIPQTGLMYKFTFPSKYSHTTSSTLSYIFLIESKKWCIFKWQCVGSCLLLKREQRVAITIIDFIRNNPVDCQQWLNFGLVCTCCDKCLLRWGFGSSVFQP